MSLNPTNLYIQAAPLPATFVGTPNDFFSEMIRRMKILSPSGTNFIFIGDTAPTSNVGPWLKNGTQWFVWDPATKQYIPQDITSSFTPAFVVQHAMPSSTNPPVWLQTTADATTNSSGQIDYGNPIRWYLWSTSLSLWVWPNPTPSGTQEGRLWFGAETEVWAYDGGDGVNPATTAPTAATGAMWQVNHALDFKFPVGAGANTVTYNGGSASAIGVGVNGGEEQHTLLAVEQGLPVENIGVPAVLGGYGGGTAFKTADASNAHNNMPPYLGVLFIQRTNRVYYTPTV